MSGALGRVLLIGGGVISVGYGVSQYAASRPIGAQIPEARAQMRTQGAQGEAVKAGMEKEEAQKKIKKVETHGGDKGMQYGGAAPAGEGKPQ